MPILTMKFNARDDEGKSVQAPVVFARFGLILEVMLVSREGMIGTPPSRVTP